MCTSQRWIMYRELLCSLPAACIHRGETDSSNFASQKNKKIIIIQRCIKRSSNRMLGKAIFKNDRLPFILCVLWRGLKIQVEVLFPSCRPPHHNTTHQLLTSHTLHRTLAVLPLPFRAIEPPERERQRRREKTQWVKVKVFTGLILSVSGSHLQLFWVAMWSDLSQSQRTDYRHGMFADETKL